MTSSRRSVSTGAEWETRYSYHRAVAVGERAWVSGTTASSRGDEPHPDPAVQAKTAFTIALEALAGLGFGRDDVVLTRMYVTDMDAADVIGHVHGEVFQGVNPVSTMVAVAGLIDPRLKVEIEVEAVKDADT